ncbi:MAG: biopolymer transporter ExbD [Candidatus Omnitrophica bacterium]|jgi:biopolymer transport protein ExbD|nr:biopolymer transporter ExbD [Candidatus Omnitrophota bacterium]
MNLRKPKQKLIAEINIAPFTDVILVLLIIFMITTPLILQTSLKVNLPQAASAAPVNETGPINIVITNEGVVYLDGVLVTRKELRERVSLRHKSDPSLGVIVSSDRLVRFKDIVGVLDILNTVGIRNLNIAATTER